METTFRDGDDNQYPFQFIRPYEPKGDVIATNGHVMLLDPIDPKYTQDFIAIDRMRLLMGTVSVKPEGDMN